MSKMRLGIILGGCVTRIVAATKRLRDNCGSMSKYFFNIVDGDRMVLDEEGMDVADLESALREACAGARDMIRDALLAGDDISKQVIQVVDADGELQASIAIRSLTKQRIN